MENAAKALLIAAGILVGLILITMIMYGHGKISNYYKEKEENREIEQMAEFNKQYIGYNRDDVRGSEILTLINKVIDYNAKLDDEESEDSIGVLIQKLGNSGKNFYYKYDENSGIKLIEISTAYTQDNIYTAFLSEANSIESHYTQAIATKLAANISTIMGDNTRKTKKDLLVELKMMDAEDSETKANNIVKNQDILKYYQYLQFKRAHFDCVKLEYQKGRVKNFTFKFNGTFE